MRKVEGFVCLVTSVHAKAFFGRNIHNGLKYYQNFESNGLVPFDFLLEAELAQEELLQLRHTQSVTIHKIRMEMTENVTEFEQLKNKKNLAVVACLEDGVTLLGRRVTGKGHIGHIPGTILADSIYAVFRQYSSALRTVEEVVRQGASNALLTTFEIETC